MDWCPIAATYFYIKVKKCDAIYCNDSTSEQIEACMKCGDTGYIATTTEGDLVKVVFDDDDIKYGWIACMICDALYCDGDGLVIDPYDNNGEVKECIKCLGSGIITSNGRRITYMEYTEIIPTTELEVTPIEGLTVKPIACNCKI